LEGYRRALREAGLEVEDRLIFQAGNSIEDGAKEILAISLMGGGEYEAAPRSLPELIARTLQLSLHHQMLSDYERLRDRARIVVLCPITAPTASATSRKLKLSWPAFATRA